MSSVAAPRYLFSQSRVPFRLFESGPNLRHRDHSSVCVTVGWILRDRFSVDGKLVTSFAQIVLKSGSVEAFSHANKGWGVWLVRWGQTLRAFGDLRDLELKRVGGMLSVSELRRCYCTVVLMLWSHSRRARLEWGGEGAVYLWDGRCVKRELNVPPSFEKGEFCEEDLVPRRINFPGATVDPARTSWSTNRLQPPQGQNNFCCWCWEGSSLSPSCSG